MKIIAYLLATLSVASAFAPAPLGGRQNTAMNALFNEIFRMDLWEPVKDSNNYGARNKKNLKQGKITPNSYVPAGLSVEEYNKIRAADESKKNAKYNSFASKAGKFLGFNEFYQKRGTDLNQAWVKDPTKGHRMAKTKYDYSGSKNEVKLWDGIKE